MAGAFKIGIVPGVTPDKWVRVWRERLPRESLLVVAVPDPGAALLDGVDMVFARLPVEEPDGRALRTIRLWDETPVVVVPKDHPAKLFDTVTLADIADEEVLPGWSEQTLDLVAAGHGVALMPRSVFRATGRRDVIDREISDAEATTVGLVWLTSTTGPLVDEFIGIVRGRTANSSRGEPTPPAAPPKKAAPPPRRKPPANGARGARGRRH